MQKDANLPASNSWAVSVGSLLQHGQWLQQQHLSAASVALTLTGSGTAQEAGNLAAHKVKKRHILMAVDKMADNQAAWRELFDYSFSA